MYETKRARELGDDWREKDRTMALLPFVRKETTTFLVHTSERRTKR